MSELDLDAIEARAEAATEGPWDWRVSDDRRWAVVDTASNNRDDNDRNIARLADDDNAEFIAHARTDVAALLAEVTRLRAENERLQYGWDYALTVAEELKAENERLRAKVARVEALADRLERNYDQHEADEIRAALADPEEAK